VCKDVEGNLTDIAKHKAGGQKIRTIKSSLESCEIVQKPMQREWNDLGVFGGAQVCMWTSDTTLANTGSSKGMQSNKICTAVIKLESRGKDGVNVFIEEAFKLFQKQLGKLKTHH
jgi:hypothetical protein